MAKKIVTASRSSGNLNFKTAQKMINRLLTQDRIKTALDDGKVINPALPSESKIIMKPYTKEELTKKLDITLEEFENLKFQDFYEKMANKVSLLLISLYCATKFLDGG